MIRYSIVLLALVGAPLAAQQPADSIVVEVNGEVTVFRSLAGLPRDTVTATFHNAPPRPYSGVNLRVLLERAGLQATRLRGPLLARYVVVEATDGYRVSFGLAALDTGLVSRRLVLVDSLDGQALEPGKGPWRLIVAGDDHGARSVRMVSAIRVREPLAAQTQDLSPADSALAGRILSAEDRRDPAAAALSLGEQHSDPRIRLLARRAAERIRDPAFANRDSFPALPAPPEWPDPAWR
ncbi:MAG: molybdopterin-dependent oxidoreductase, partial [Gemmatimonadales bacterium]